MASLKRKSTSDGDGQFMTTRWSVVLKAAQTKLAEADEALSTLCKNYWYPLYAFVRRQGYSSHDAQDLTQGFFARFLEKKDFKAADRAKGRFRSFLLASLKHFLANQYDRATAQKRGGKYSFISLDEAAAESRYSLEPIDQFSAEKIFERRWALTLLENVLDQLRKEFVREGKRELFEELKIFLSGGKDSRSYAEAAHRLNMSEGTIKISVHRMRQRYRKLLRAEIAQTVADPSEIDAELRYLFSAMSL